MQLHSIAATVMYIYLHRALDPYNIT